MCANAERTLKALKAEWDDLADDLARSRQNSRAKEKHQRQLQGEIRQQETLLYNCDLQWESSRKQTRKAWHELKEVRRHEDKTGWMVDDELEKLHMNQEDELKFARGSRAEIHWGEFSDVRFQQQHHQDKLLEDVLSTDLPDARKVVPVSYTHLTLPTICSV